MATTTYRPDLRLRVASAVLGLPAFVAEAHRHPVFELRPVRPASS